MTDHSYYTATLATTVRMLKNTHHDICQNCKKYHCPQPSILLTSTRPTYSFLHLWFSFQDTTDSMSRVWTMRMKMKYDKLYMWQPSETLIQQYIRSRIVIIWCDGLQQSMMDTGGPIASVILVLQQPW